MINAVADRIVQGTLANLLGKAWVVGLQLLMLPVLTRFWGVEGYGVWLLITSIPTYLALSEAGLGTVAAVELTRRVVSGDTAGARQLIQSLWSLMTAASLGLGLLLVGAGAIGLAQGWFTVPGLSPETMLGAIVATTIYALLVVQMLVLNVVYRATNKYASGTLLLDIATPVEGAAVLFVAWKGGDLSLAACGMLLVRALFAAFYFFRLLRAEPWLKLGYRHARWAQIRQLLGPSAAAFSLVGANAVLLQGMVLAVGATGGVVAAATFASSRMISRIPLQFANLVSRASIPELARAEATGAGATSGKLVGFNIAWALVMSLPFAIMLSVFGPAILTWMSGDTLDVDSALFSLLGASAVVGAIWTSASSRLVATNEVGRFSYWYLAACLCATGLVFVGVAADLQLAAMALLMAELVGLAAVLANFASVPLLGTRSGLRL